MNLELTDKVAIITGASRGLGLAAARALLAEGARVSLCARGGEALALAAAGLNGGDRVHAVIADVSTPEGAERVVADTLRVWGRVDILVNNVGKAGGAGIAATPTRTGRARWIRRCFRPSACRGWSCRTCGWRAAAPSS